MSRNASLAKRIKVEEMQRVLRHAEAVCLDVDSTVCQDEGIDELANFCQVGEAVERLTSSAMNGGMSFRQALTGRLDIMKPNLDDIVAFVKEHPPKLTDGVREVVRHLLGRGTHVYLVSGGFESLILPVARELKIPDENVFANRLHFYHNGEYAGFDTSAPTSESGGKTRVAEHLKAKYNYQNLLFIGDGATDLETYPTADGFIGFGGNKVRESVLSGAPWYVFSFQEVYKVLTQPS